MQVKAEQKSIRMAPRKVRLVANLVRNLEINEALDQLASVNKRAVKPMIKTLNQAVANAVNNHKANKENLVIKEIQIGEGPTYKRWQPVSRGRAHSILKRTSKIRIILETKEEKQPDGKLHKMKNKTPKKQAYKVKKTTGSGSKTQKKKQSKKGK